MFSESFFFPPFCWKQDTQNKQWKLEALTTPIKGKELIWKKEYAYLQREDNLPWISWVFAYTRRQISQALQLC